MVMLIKSRLDLQCSCGAAWYTIDYILNESENKKGFSVIKGISHRQETRRWRIFLFVNKPTAGQRLWTGKSNWILKLLDSKEKDKHKKTFCGIFSGLCFLTVIGIKNREIGGFLSGLTEQRRQPVDVGFTVRIQESKDFSSSHWCSQQPCADKTLTLLGAHDTDLRKSGHVLLQMRLQVLWKSEKKTEITRKNAPGKKEMTQSRSVFC